MAFGLATCQPAEETQQVSMFPGVELTPYATSTLNPTVTSTPVTAPTATMIPTITPTPITYTVKSSDTLFSIAAKNGLTLDEIKAANPAVDPYLLHAGMTILIPAAGGQQNQATQSAPVSTPYPLTLGEPQCMASLTGGLYCFVEITNGQEITIGNITADFILTDQENGDTLTQAALVPLNRIDSGSKLPLFAYFPPPVIDAPVVALQLDSAMSLSESGSSSTTQPAVLLEDPEIALSANGLSAVVSTQAVIEPDGGTVGRIWVAAVAYDAQGNIVGIRRFESNNSSNPGEAVSFTLNIYSIGGKIDRVELFGEVNS